MQHLAAASELRLSRTTLLSRNMAGSPPSFRPMRSMIQPFSLSSTLHGGGRRGLVVNSWPALCSACAPHATGHGGVTGLSG